MCFPRTSTDSGNQVLVRLEGGLSKPDNICMCAWTKQTPISTTCVALEVYALNLLKFEKFLSLDFGGIGGNACCGGRQVQLLSTSEEESCTASGSASRLPLST